LTRQPQFDATRAEHAIVESLRAQVGVTLRRGGAVVALSGGVDSAVCAALAARAFGPDRVLAVAMPEREGDALSLSLAQDWAAEIGTRFAVEDITAALEATGCYARRDEAVRRVFPRYAAGWRCKLVLDAGPGGDSAPARLNVWHLVAADPAGNEVRARLAAREYREIVAATNCKQRVRTLMAYHHADRLGYAVVGTANRLEHDQGFFVKGGDGLADVKPIAHLYKTEVYLLAARLGVPPAIRSRVPTTDTYSLSQTQEEFYFTARLGDLDAALAARNAGRDAADLAAEQEVSPAAIDTLYRQIDRKRAATRYLHLPPLLVEPVPEVGAAPAPRAG
jgi:NAD+ synthase